MKIKFFTLAVVSIFFLSTSVLANNHSDDDKKKTEKKSKDIKTIVKERETAPVNEDSSIAYNSETYDYMSSPKLEDCTKSDFDRE